MQRPEEGEEGRWGEKTCVYFVLTNHIIHLNLRKEKKVCRDCCYTKSSIDMIRACSKKKEKGRKAGRKRKEELPTSFFFFLSHESSCCRWMDNGRFFLESSKHCIIIMHACMSFQDGCNSMQWRNRFLIFRFVRHSPSRRRVSGVKFGCAFSAAAAAIIKSITSNVCLNQWYSSQMGGLPMQTSDHHVDQTKSAPKRCV